MSMFDDVMGLGRSSVTEGFTGFEPELEAITLESVEVLDESVDPMDFILQVAYENEINMRNLDMAIIGEEYSHLRTTGQEMVYESGNMESIIAAFKKSINWLWEQIQKFFKTVMEKFDKALKLDERFLKKYEKNAAGKKAIVNGYAPGLTVKIVADRAKSKIERLGAEAERVFDELQKDTTHTPEEELAKIRMTIFGSKEEVKDVLLSTAESRKGTKENGSYDANKAISEFRESKAQKAELKAIYDKNKKAVNSMLKAAKKMESVAKKARIVPTETSKAIHGSVKVINKLGKYMTMVNRDAVKWINKLRAQDKAIIISAAAKEPKKTNEAGSLLDAFEPGL